MTMCTRCVLPDTYRNIGFDREGVCNYCRTYEKLQGWLTDYDRLDALREDRFAQARERKGDYDCLVGISGGKDSSWIALQLARKHGLRCLGYTFDNGFMTDYALRNIETVVGKLGIDHVFHQVDPELHRSFYEQAVRHFGTPCPGCSYSSYSLSFKMAFERGIPLVVHGRSRSQMFRELLAGSPDAFLPFVELNLSPYDHRANLEATLSAAKRMQYFVSIALPDESMRQRFYDEFFPTAESLEAAEWLPEFLGYFLYQPYDERAMMAELEADLDWQRPQDKSLLTHADCGAHDAAVFLFREVMGFPMLSFELSVLIREGVLTRGEALQRLEQEPGETWVPDESLDYMCGRLEMDRGDLPDITRRLHRRNRWRNRYLRCKNVLLRPKLNLPPDCPVV